MAHQPSEARDGETMSEPLGQSLHASSVRADAEAAAMLRWGYAGMRTREESITTIDRRRLAEAVDLITTWVQPARAGVRHTSLATGVPAPLTSAWESSCASV
jgi:hypothetical protein